MECPQCHKRTFFDVARCSACGLDMAEYAASARATAASAPEPFRAPAPMPPAEPAEPAARGVNGGRVLLGVVLIVVGIAVSAASYSAASESGGHYVMLTGLIGVGIVQLIRGLAGR